MNNSAEEIARSLTKTLDSHGYSYQYAVIRKAEELFREKKSRWRFLGAELPVSVNGAMFHVDFVFKHSENNVFLIGECKRADPARSIWSFVKAPYTFNDDDPVFTYFDQFEFTGGSRFPLRYDCRIKQAGRSIYQIAQELRTDKPGAGYPDSKNPINHAIAQSIRGVSGFENAYFENLSQFLSDPKNTRYYFLPAVFTTAKIWATDHDIAGADLKSGHLQPDLLTVREMDYIWFNHHRSKELTHSVSALPVGGLNTSVSKQFSRSVAVVGSDGVEKFFKANLGEWISRD